jgi:hypothetical protein
MCLKLAHACAGSLGSISVQHLGTGPMSNTNREPCGIRIVTAVQL